MKRTFTFNRTLRQLLTCIALIFSTLLHAQTMLAGLTANGGPEGRGTAFSVSTTGSNFSLIGSFADWGKAPIGNLYKNTDGNFYGMTSDGGTFNYGTIFMMTPAGKVTILKQFINTTDGGYPNGELIKGADGYLYGATTNGGVNSYGTIFKISTSGSFTVLKSMTYNEGVSIYGHLLLASDGNFYGITYRGGTTGAGTIFKLTTAGVYSVIHTLTTAEGSSSNSSLVEGKDGNLYGTTATGGASGYGSVFKITKAGVLTVLKSFNGSTDGYYCKSDLIQAADGYFYGTCPSGGASGSGTIFKIASTGTYTVVKSFNYSTDGSTPNGGLFQNSDGNFYGITKNGGAKSGGTIYKLTSTYAFSVIHALDYATEGYLSSSTLVKGDDGKLYALAQTAGTYNMGTAFSVTTTGTLTVLANFNGATQGNAPYESFTKGKDSAYYATTSNGGAYGYGTVIKICGGVTTVLHSFKQSTEGGNPKGSLLLANDGYFYGTTSTGGTGGYGTIFKISSLGSFNVLYSLKYADGANLFGDLIQAKDGYLYGMASSGGAGSGTIFKVSLTGTFTVLRSFVSSTDGSSPNGNLIQASDGNFYGMTTSSGKIFKLTSANVFTVLHTFVTADGYYPYGSLIQGTDGNLYGTCSEGGANSAGTVFQMSLAGTYKVVRSFKSTTDGKTPKGNLLQAPDGYLYGITSAGGTYDGGTIFKLSTSGATFSVLKQLNIITDGGSGYGSLILAPANNLVANAQKVTVNEDKTVSITLTGSGGSTLTYSTVAQPLHGKLAGTGTSRVYTPTANYNGKDSFSFRVSVGCLASTPAYVTITVNPVADTPVLAPIGNKTVTKNNKLTFTAKATDADSVQQMKYSLIGAPSGAVIGSTTGVFSWTPATAGSYTFKVRATDHGVPALYDEEQITVTVKDTTTLLPGNGDYPDFSWLCKIFPNPVIDILNIQLISKIPGTLSLKIFNTNGTLLKSATWKDTNKILLNVSQLPAGVYYAQVTLSGISVTLKFVKV